eukprot:5668109-Pleurochrysis_carterae.AAC.1
MSKHAAVVAPATTSEDCHARRPSGRRTSRHATSEAHRLTGTATESVSLDRRLREKMGDVRALRVEAESGLQSGGWVSSRG